MPTDTLVVGGTGQQGRSVVDELLARTDDDIAVLTRNPAVERAQMLSKRGVAIVEGNLLDQHSVTRALSGVDRAFFLTDYPSGGDPAVERRQGEHVVAAAVDQGLDQLVYSSTIDATIARAVPHFDAKAAVETRLTEADVTSTVLRPAPFYQNFETFAGAVRSGFFPFPVERTTSLPMVDVRDVGRAAAIVFSDPDRYAGGVYPVVAETHTLGELARRFGRVHGVKMTPVSVPLRITARITDTPVAAMFAWFRRYGQIRSPVRGGLDFDARCFEMFLDAADSLSPAGASCTVAELTAPVRPPL